MPYLNFHGHVLPGKLVRLDEHIDQHRIAMDYELARWCHYELRLYGDTGMACSEDSRIVRTNLRLLVAALYADWENVTTLLPVETVEAAIVELQTMIEISKEYPVMVWEYNDSCENNRWVSTVMAKLPSLDSANMLFDLPHLRTLYSDFNRYCERNDCRTFPCCDRFAEKAMKKALAERNKRIKLRRRDALKNSPKV